MNATVEDLRSTIIPRSDQINSDQLLGGPLIITITDVRVGSSAEQPVSIFYATDPARPYRPCLTMRKVLVHAWGADGTKWIGRSIELYNDPTIKFGGETVGGIRISRLSDIPKEIRVSLTATKGRKALHEIGPLKLSGALSEVLADIAAATGRDSLKKARAKAEALKSQADVELAVAAYKKRVEALKEQASGKTAETVDRSTAQVEPTDRPDTGAESTAPEQPDRQGGEHPAAGQDGAGGANGAGPKVTYAQVATALSRASTRDALDEAALLIDAVESAQHRKELQGKYQERLAALRDGAGREAA